MTQQPPPWGPPPGSPQQWAPAPAPSPEDWAERQRQDQRRLAHPHPQARSYPLMLRTWSYAWWKPPVGVLLGIVTFFVVQVALTIFLVIGAVTEGGSKPLGQRINELSQLDKVTPWTMLYLNLGLASLTLVAWLVVRVVHGMRPRWLASVRPGLRWRFFLACLGIAVVAMGASLVVGAFVPGDSNGTTGTAHLPTGQLLATAIVILFTTPLQALGEEYGFRGYLMQAFGSFTGSRIAALAITSTLFALAHGTQNAPLFLDRFLFGLMAGVLVIVAGGLEAGIALHVLNNLVAFGIAIAFDQLDSTLTVSSASWWQLPVTLTQDGIFLLLVLLVVRRMGLRNTTEPPPAT